MQALLGDSIRESILRQVALGPRREEELQAGLGISAEAVRDALSMYAGLQLITAEPDVQPVRYRLNVETVAALLQEWRREDVTIPVEAPALEIGSVAPGFELPGADGQSIRLADYLGSRRLVLWFSRGIMCPFCGRYRAELAGTYSDFADRNAEILEVTPSKLHQAQLFNQRRAFKFPYLCDPDAHAAWPYGAVYPEDRTNQFLLKFVIRFFQDTKGETTRVRDELYATHPEAASDPDLQRQGGSRLDAIYVLDREGKIRYKLTGDVGLHPAHSELTASLDQMG